MVFYFAPDSIASTVTNCHPARDLSVDPGTISLPLLVNAMHSTVLDGIRTQLDQLSQEEQLWLIEQLAHRLRGHSRQSSLQAELAEMASDPAMQREIREISEEFRPTEGDGLEDL